MTRTLNGPLNGIMEFDHVIEVHADGSITDRNDVHAPAVYHEEIHPDGTTRSWRNPPGWTFMDGYSGQDRYPGPIMHPSEYIGGGLETDIRENAGVYAAVVVYSLEGDDADGWAVLVWNG